MLGALRAGSVAHIENHIGARGLLQCGLKRLYQLVRQPAYQADRINQHNRAPIRQSQGAGGGVERCKELILRQHARMSERIHQGGFPGVGIADDRHRFHSVFIAPLPQPGPPAPHNFELIFQRVDPPPDMPAIAFQLAFAWAARADATAQAGKLRALAAQARQGIFELCKLYLQLAFA